MAPRYQQHYRIKIGDNLGSPDFWNPRFQDIDLRLVQVEGLNIRADVAVQQIIQLGIDRINATFDPLIAEAQSKVDQVGDITTTIDGGTFSPNAVHFNVLLYRSATTGAVPASLASGRLAINEADGLLFYRKADGTVGSLSLAGNFVDAHLTGASTAPTVSGYTDNTTAIATTAFVQAVATALLQDTNLSGAPTAANPDPASNTTRIATTQFVKTVLNTFAGTVDAALGNRVRFDVGQSLSVAAIHQQRANVLGSPLASLKLSNLHINPRADISQQFGNVGSTLTNNVSLHAVDDIATIVTAGSGSVLCDRQPSSAWSQPLPGFDYAARLAAPTAIGTFTSGVSRAYHWCAFEAIRTFNLCWGTARARRLGYAFQYYTVNPGYIMVRAHNPIGDRFNYKEHAVISGWNFIAGSFIGDTSGDWSPSGANVGLYLTIACAGAETTPQATLNAWGTTYKMRTTNVGNLLNTNGSYTMLTGLCLMPDMDFSLFDASLLEQALPDMCMNEDEALDRCLRYYYRSETDQGGWGWGVAGNNMLGQLYLPKKMRDAPMCQPYGNPAGNLIQYDGVNATTTNWTFAGTGGRTVHWNAAGGSISTAQGKPCTIRLGYSLATGIEANARIF